MGIPLRVGIVGAGKISEQYLANLPSLTGLRLAAVADLDVARARQIASQQGVAALTVDELLGDPSIDAVLNLTIPAAHVEVGLRALDAGKHVFAEKPLGLSPDEARPLLSRAAAAGLRVGSAPDTVLGTGIQTARQLLDSGAVGEALGAQVHWSAPGHERWHPAPAFYYQPGGGPLYDMGPYYLTALVHFFGPIVRVTGLATRSGRARTVATGPAAGSPLAVDVDTHVGALLEHAGGAVSTVTVSFEVWATRSPQFEVYGSAGTIAVPDPNRFSDTVELATSDDPVWRQVPPSAGYVDTGRGVGLADLAAALESGAPHRASGELAFHVLEVMDAVTRSSAARSTVAVRSTVERPALVPLGPPPGFSAS